MFKGESVFPSIDFSSASLEAGETAGGCPCGAEASVCSQGVGGKGPPRCSELRKAAPGPSNSESPQDAFDDPKVPDLTGDPALLHLRVPHWPGEERSKD